LADNLPSGRTSAHPLLLPAGAAVWAVPQTLRARRTPSGSSRGPEGVRRKLAAARRLARTDGSIVSPSAANSPRRHSSPPWDSSPPPASSPRAHSRTPLAPWPVCGPTPRPSGRPDRVDDRDPASRESRGKALTEDNKFSIAQGLKGARIGVARKKLFATAQPPTGLIEAALQVGTAGGAVLVDRRTSRPWGQVRRQRDPGPPLRVQGRPEPVPARARSEAPIHSLKTRSTGTRRTAGPGDALLRTGGSCSRPSKGPLTSAEYGEALAKDHELSGQGGSTPPSPSTS